MKDPTPIAVTSRSFSGHAELRAELLERYSNVRFNDEGLSLTGETLIKFARGRRKLITSLERIDEEILTALPELEVLSKFGVGTDMLDMAALARNRVRLGWTGGVNQRSVAELAVAMMLSLLRHIPRLVQEVADGTWKNHQGLQLSGRTVGIIGCGHVGKDLIRLLGPFECRILSHDVLDFPEFYKAHDVEAVELEALLSRADVVSLHVPLDDSTRGMLSRDRLSLLKRNAILINTARGGLVDEQSLATMLREKRLAGAAFDVFANEPPVNHELLSAPNFLATPHIGGSSKEAVLAMGRAAIRGLDENELPETDLVDSTHDGDRGT